MTIKSELWTIRRKDKTEWFTWRGMFYVFHTKEGAEKFIQDVVGDAHEAVRVSPELDNMRKILVD